MDVVLSEDLPEIISPDFFFFFFFETCGLGDLEVRVRSR